MAQTAPAGQAGATELRIERLEAPQALAALVNGRRWNELLELAGRGVATSPGDPAWQYWMGVARFHQGNFAQAAVSLRSAEKLGLNSAPLHEALGVDYYALHQYALFRQQMDKASQADPADALPYHYLGRYYEHDLNHYDAAIAYFDKALERAPGDFKSLYFRAFCLQMLRRDAEAEAGFKAAIQRVEAGGERFGWPYQKMAELLRPNDPQASLRYARKAVELEPAVESNHLVLAKTCELLGNLSTAIQECLEAARLKPNDPSIRYLLFRLYKKKGDSRAAAAQLKIHEELRSIYASK